jgi:hypothetical protein
MRQSLATLRLLGPFPAVSVAVACAVAAAAYLIGHRADSHASPLAAPAAASLHGAAPGPAEFARQLAGLANQFSAQAGGDVRLTQVDCVQGAHRGHYMCSFALLRTSGPMECHLIQAIWTPTEVDSFRVTLSGRAARCGSLRDAIQSLQ